MHGSPGDTRSAAAALPLTRKAGMALDLVRRFGLSRVLLPMAAAALLSACTTASMPQPKPITGKRALIDSYLVAHGMALGYARSGRAGPA